VVAPDKEAMKKSIYDLIYKSGINGITSDVLETVIGIPKNKWSGRLTDLVDEEKVKVNGEVQKQGPKKKVWFGIWVAMEHIRNEEKKKVDENGQIKIF
jgi:hypothetical protein